jgi:Mg/Co/Ni transporter MgtE
VFDYTAGQQDWFAYGLPREGAAAATPWAGDHARRDVPTCHLAERVGAVRERARTTGWSVCVVVNDERVVLGLLCEPALGADPEATVESVMAEGPSTFRPSTPVAEMREYFEKHDLDSAPITTSDGRLIGLLCRDQP